MTTLPKSLESRNGSLCSYYSSLIISFLSFQALCFTVLDSSKSTSDTGHRALSCADQMAPKEMPKESKPKGPKKSETPSQPEAPQIDPTDFSPQDKDRLDEIVRNKLYLDDLIVPKKDSISHSWRLLGWKDEVR